MQLGHQNFNFSGRLKPIIILLYLSSTLLACSSQIQQRAQAPQHLSKDIDPIETKNWQWKGKFVIKSEEVTEAGGLTWLKTGDDNFVSIRGPMGIGLRKFLIRHGEIQSLNVEQTREIHRITELLGVELPLNRIPLWLLGKESAKSHKSQEKSKKIRTFEQSGWHITFKSWNKYQNALLPSEIIAKNKSIEIKIITLSWSPTIK